MIDGKRYSRRETTRFDPADPDQLRRALAPGCGDRVEHYRTMSARFLESQGLPAAPVVYWWQELQEWRVELPPPESRELYGPPPEQADLDRLRRLLGPLREAGCAPAPVGLASRSLTHHIAELGHERDSLPDLAARIVVLGSMIENAKRVETKIELAMQLQEAATLARVYGLDSIENRKNAKAGRGKPWALELARELKTKYPKLTQKAWQSIPEGDGDERRYAGWEVWRDDDTLHADDGKRRVRLTREQFRKKYFYPAECRERR